MFEALGVVHQVEAVTGASLLSLGVLVGLAFLVYVNPAALRIAIPAAVLVLSNYGSFVYGDRTGLADGRAEIQVKWDTERAAAEATRAAEQKRQARERIAQEQQDAQAAADLVQQDKDALTAIAGAAATDDGAVPKVLRDSWTRERAARGLK
jgi:hypothetical protein